MAFFVFILHKIIALGSGYPQGPGGFNVAVGLPGAFFFGGAHHDGIHL